MMTKAEKSHLLTALLVLGLFFLAIVVVVIAPNYTDSSWINPCSSYQVQMYEISDPNIYINAASKGSEVLQFVRRLQKDFTLLSFEESETLRIIAPKELEVYVTHPGEKPLKLTSRVLFMKEAIGEKSDTLRQELQGLWSKDHPGASEKPYFEIKELYECPEQEGFAVIDADSITDPFVDKDFVILGETKAEYHKEKGVIYVKNPHEYRISLLKSGLSQEWQYDPSGKEITSMEQMSSLGFMTRKELIAMGEEIYKIEGCWYCHTDQSRTLVQDCVLNGSDSYPAPPSCASEYIYQDVTFPGTRRIGPDLSRVGIKRPSRDWHKSHFWSPKTKSAGSIMPAFRHFFDDDPRGVSKNPYGVPNYKFEAIFQYLMTKGTRITAPTQAWWLGLDPIQTLKILDSQ